MFFNKWSYSDWLSIYLKNKLDPHFTPSVKINSKGIRDLNAKPKTLEKFWKKTGEIDIGLGNNFLHTAQRNNP